MTTKFILWCDLCVNFLCVFMRTATKSFFGIRKEQKLQNFSRKVIERETLWWNHHRTTEKEREKNLFLIGTCPILTGHIKIGINLIREKKFSGWFYCLRLQKSELFLLFFFFAHTIVFGWFTSICLHANTKENKHLPTSYDLFGLRNVSPL